MVLLPGFNWLALTVSDAVAVPPEPERLEVPSDLPPSVKETEPVGEALPLAAFTVAVSTLLPPAVMLVGLAVMVVMVATTETVKATVTDPDEALNVVLPP